MKQVFLPWKESFSLPLADRTYGSTKVDLWLQIKAHAGLQTPITPTHKYLLYISKPPWWHPDPSHLSLTHHQLSSLFLLFFLTKLQFPLFLQIALAMANILYFPSALTLPDPSGWSLWLTIKIFPTMKRSFQKFLYSTPHIHFQYQKNLISQPAFRFGVDRVTQEAATMLTVYYTMGLCLQH